MRLAKPQQPEPLSRPKLYPFTLMYALLISICVTAQLFTIDKLFDHPHFQTPFGIIILPLMVLIAVFSLPSILQLSTSRLMNLLSFLCAVTLPVVWFCFALYIQPIEREVGLLGTHLTGSFMTWLIVLSAFLLGFLNFRALGAPRLKK